MKRRTTLFGLAGAAAASGGWTTARAESAAEYPSRPVRVIVPYAAGGGTDIWGRIATTAMAADLGQPFVVENRGGASGMIGTEAAARAPADGYNLLYTITTHVQAPVVLRRWSYDPIKDFMPIGRLGTTSLALVTRSETPANTLEEFVAWAKGKRMGYGSYAQGSIGHAFGLMFNQTAGLGMEHVSYRGEAPMAMDILNGQIAFGFHSPSVVGGHLKAGRMKALACSGERRIPSLPQVPTMLELGYPKEFGSASFNGLLAPAAVPQPILDKLAASFRKAAQDPDLQRRLIEIDVVPDYLGPQEFRDYMAAYLEDWKQVTERLNLYAES